LKGRRKSWICLLRIKVDESSGALPLNIGVKGQGTLKIVVHNTALPHWFKKTNTQSYVLERTVSFHTRHISQKKL